MRFFLFLLLSASSWSVGYPLVPDDKITQGDMCTVTNSDFAGYRYKEQIPYCARNVTTGLKRTIYAAYGVPGTQQEQYTIDHFIPLSLGGSNKRGNLWPEHRQVKALRPNLELELYIALRDGEITQKDAIQTILEAKLHPCDKESEDVAGPVLANRNACRMDPVAVVY